MIKSTINEAIKMIMKENGFKQQSMAEAIGKKKATDVSARLANANMTFDKAIEMLNVMGYEVTVQPRSQGKRPNGQIVIIKSDDVSKAIKEND